MDVPLMHILHLTDQALHWAGVKRAARGLELVDSLTIESPAPQSLDEWIERHGHPRGKILLYDGRSMYFSFLTTAPARAKKQFADIVKLKIRQELGVGDDSVYWTMSSTPSKTERGQLDLFTIVSRKQSLEDLRDWQRRHDIESLWIGADLCAIRALVSHGILPAPVLVLNGDARGANLFHSASVNEIVKSRLDSARGKTDGSVLDFELNGSTRRAVFGTADGASLLESHPELQNMPPVSALDSAALGRAGLMLPDAECDLSRLDAVILGGMIEAARGEPSMPSLVRTIPTQEDRAALSALKLRWIIPFLILSVVALGVSVIGIRGQRETARLDLVERAQSISSALSQLQSQEKVLKQIQTDRSPIIPVFRLIHEAAPDGVQIESLGISNAGVLQMSGSVKSRNAANELANQLSKSNLLTSIDLTEIKSGAKGGTFTFKITARIKSRVKKGGRTR